MNDDAKKLYEVSFLAKSENGAALMVEHLSRFDAEILNEGDLKKIELAYPIEKEESAFFGSINCKLPKDSISKINDVIKLDKEIMRMLIIEPEVTREKTEEQSSTRRPTESSATTESKPAKKEESDGGALSNELLEEKLEEILQ